jgi:hypothetical protein
MKFIRALDGTAINADQIVSVGSANTIRGSKGFGPYLMVTLSNGQTAVPITDTGIVWHEDSLDEFLKVAAS